MGTNNPKVVFFEWSDIKRQPIGFNNVEEFKDFCNNSKILINANNKYYLNVIKNNIYAICKKDKPELVLSSSLKGLKKNLNKHNHKNNS